MKRMLIFSIIVFFIILMLPIVARAIQEGPEQARQEVEEATSEKRESGMVSLDFEGADIRNVIRVITMASGLNMVIGEDVRAKVTISLKDVPWEKALDVILRTYNFTYKKEENLIRVMTFKKVKQEENNIPLTTKIIYLNFAKAKKMDETIKKSLSKRGAIAVNEETNSLIITDIPARIEAIEKAITELDIRTPQVLIEAMLVDVKLTKDDELGINWNIVHVDRHKEWYTLDPNITKNYIEQPGSPMSNITDTAIRFGWLEKLGTFRLEGLIKAWAQDAKANILASPKIVTLDNHSAEIVIESQVPYTQHTTTEEGSTTSRQFKSVKTRLWVKPQITKGGFISMELEPRQEFVEAWPGGEPQIGTRYAKTTVLVKDGETIVIGGLRKVEDTATITKVPILGDIPFIGNLFRKKDVQKVNTELVMFVTPHIIVYPELTDEEIHRYEMLDGAREEFLKEQQRQIKKRLKRRKKQARLIEPRIIKEITLPEEEIIEEVEMPPSPVIKEERIEQGPQEDKGYIYSW